MKFCKTNPNWRGFVDDRDSVAREILAAPGKIKFDKSDPIFRIESMTGTLGKANLNPISVRQSQFCTCRSALAGLPRARLASKAEFVRAPPTLRGCAAGQAVGARRRSSAPCLSALFSFSKARTSLSR